MQKNSLLLPVSSTLMMISCGSTGVVGDFEKLDLFIESLEADLLIEYLEPPKMGVQSRFIRALSMSAVDPRGDLLKEARADLLLASCGDMLNEDLGDTLWKRLKDALLISSIVSEV